MSEDFIVNAVVRTDKGKGASRRLRRVEGVPAILYGGHKDPVMLTLKSNEVKKHLEHESFYSHILSVAFDGVTEKAVLRAVQRHPSKPVIMHMDFQRVSADEKLSMNVPLHFVNEDTCPGVKAGGLVSHTVTEVAIVCLPKDLPEYIEVDMSAMNDGDVIHLSDLVMPNGVEMPELALGEEHDHPVVSIHIRNASADDEATDDGEAAASEGDED
ncbi:MAG: 50S ribosomal protein L25/general stress protein Ctc [Gammaproteobacteria bacterium]|nr:50S ribosomal protein L25/general stress protein Ctc [Gammaproteobacteria bacterium]MCP5136278.1 50S ribosomal protein L25/general stress protein Ctc [Gammaproteobacteria bacterium]